MSVTTASFPIFSWLGATPAALTWSDTPAVMPPGAFSPESAMLPEPPCFCSRAPAPLVRSGSGFGFGFGFGLGFGFGFGFGFGL